MTISRSAEANRVAFAEDVRAGLSASPRKLPSHYFYDELGSQLFEAICQLPWYPITRAERALLERHAGEIVTSFPDLGELCELGCGSGDKIALLVHALEARGAALSVQLIDVSEKAHALSRQALARFSSVEVTSHVGTYEAGLAALPATVHGRRLVLFLGSNIGNFDPDAAHLLLVAIRRALRPGDGLLLGADLVRAEAELVMAYDDPLGVTAAFDKNLLQRMNAELGADFELGAFAHQARWNARASRMEMHLVSRCSQRVRVPAAGLDLAFAEGESIWTESSYKYTPPGIVAMGKAADLGCAQQWIERESGFSTTLFVAGP